MSKARDERTATYAVKRDRLPTALLAVGLWVLVFYCLATALEASVAPGRQGPVEIAGRLVSGVPVIGFLCILYRPARYKLSDDLFSVGKGPWRVRIALSDIESVTNGQREGRDRTSYGSTASQGLLIRERGRKRLVFISPEDAREFVRDLAERCPHLEMREIGALRDPDVARGLYLERRDVAQVPQLVSR